MAYNLNPQELYRLPWSKNDNPNAWIEVTTKCNMACPGCYRGCDLNQNRGVHKPLKEIKEEIDLMIKIRNPQAISISGGEPLLHPDILEIVRFSRDRGLSPLLLTNATLLSEKMLIKLKKAGLKGIFIRVDSLRELEKKKTEKELNELRDYYATMINKIKGISFIVNFVVDKNNLSQVSEVIKWSNKNYLKKEVLFLILKKPVIFKKLDLKKIEDVISLEDLLSEVHKEEPRIRFSAYLGSQIENFKPKWLLSQVLFFNNHLIGSFNKKFLEFLEEEYHFKRDKYFLLPDKENYSFYFPKFLFICLICKERNLLRKVLFEIIKNPLNLFKKFKLNQIVILNPPGFVDGKRDFCDGCPDAMLYKGKLVPSCNLEEIKLYGKPFELNEKINNYC